MKKDKNSKISVRIIASVLAGLMLASVVFTVLFYLV